MITGCDQALGQKVLTQAFGFQKFSKRPPTISRSSNYRTHEVGWINGPRLPNIQWLIPNVDFCHRSFGTLELQSFWTSEVQSFRTSKVQSFGTSEVLTLASFPSFEFEILNFLPPGPHSTNVTNPGGGHMESLGRSTSPLATSSPHHILFTSELQASEVCKLVTFEIISLFFFGTLEVLCINTSHFSRSSNSEIMI
jgi:hypothetical protein